MTFYSFLEQSEKAKLPRFGRLLKEFILLSPITPAQLLIKSKIYLSAETLRIWRKSFI